MDAVSQIGGMFTGLLPTIMYWFFWGLMIFIIMAALGAGYFYLSFKYVVTEFPVHGSGTEGHFSIGKPRKNRIKKSKDGGSFLKLFPLMNKKKIEPFADEYVYPGNKLFAFAIGGELIPGKICIEELGKTIQATIKPVPHYLRNWQSLEHKKNAIEFAKDDWWDNNKNFVYMIMAVGFCCVLCGVTIYFSYEFATGGTAAISNLASKIDGMGLIKGVAPAG